jgi:hypothetical protein
MLDMRESLQATADEIGRRLGIKIEVAENLNVGYGCYQLRYRGRALVNSWRNPATMAFHLNTTLQILEAVERERQIQAIESGVQAKESV